LIPLLVQGQSTLRGVVTDSTSGEKLVGVHVVIVGTGLGVAADLNGEYLILGIPEKTFSVRVSCIGYQRKVKEFDFAGNAASQWNVRLAPIVIEGKEVVVTGQLRGQIAAMNQQLNARTIINVVSEERIQELPDANAAAAIGRLPGVSLVRSGGEASNIVVRGMSSRFALVTIDGVRMAPTSDVERSVDLSTISQGSLAGIELSKALTSDKDADGIAGSVNLVTKKAEASRMLRLDLKGAYSAIDKSANQYNLSARYGERLFDDKLGVQVSGNLESTIRSNETTNRGYDITQLQSGSDYQITTFDVRYVNEIRKRNGGSILLDYVTPDEGSIRLNTFYSATSRDYLTSYKQYPQVGTLVYDYRMVESDIKTFSTSLQGENFLMGWEADWSASFSQSERNDPFDFQMGFTETSSSANGVVVSGMRPVSADLLKGPVEQWIPFASNNFTLAFLDHTYDRSQKNLDKQIALGLDLINRYTITGGVAGELKFGGKYRHTDRYSSPAELASMDYLYALGRFARLPDGTIGAKPLAGTPFENVKLVGSGKVSFVNFLDAPPPDRMVYSQYELNPLINRDLLREWRRLNIDGFQDADGKLPEYVTNGEVGGGFYDLAENVGAGYAMNTLDIGQDLTLVTGLRIEMEDNWYSSRYTRVPLAGHPFGQGPLKDTTVSFTETIVLPNLQAIVRPTDFMNVRLAAYKALARPDFNNRLLKFVAKSGMGGNYLQLGNPALKAAVAWNYEVQTQFYSNYIGLFSVSAFYKDMKDMYHTINGVQASGQSTLDSLGIPWKTPFGDAYFSFSYPYNSSSPTRVWGFEVEHQANLKFLPQPFSNIVLSYNFTIVRSETWATTSRVENYRDSTLLFGQWVYLTRSRNVLFEKMQKLEDQPEFFGNVSLGYDLGGFSARLSYFHQGDYIVGFSGDQRGDAMIQGYSRLDLALKQKVTDYLSVSLNLCNLTNTEEGSLLSNTITGWLLPTSNIRYGMTADLGVRLEL
jgi:TonB-dependent receptor